MSKPDIHFESHDAATAYRLIPSPDGPPGTGYSSGGVLQWSDDLREGWQGHFHIAPEALDPLGQSMLVAEHKRRSSDVGEVASNFEHFEAVTSYRICPNPEAPKSVGYSWGCVLQWRDETDEPWTGNFAIAPESMEAIGIALIQSASEFTK